MSIFLSSWRSYVALALILTLSARISFISWILGFSSKFTGITLVVPSKINPNFPCFILTEFKFPKNSSSTIQVKEFKSNDENLFNKLFDYDTEMFGHERLSFLKSWLTRPQTKVFYVIDSNNDKILGYSVVRPCAIGFKVGPLFANNSEISEQLFISDCNHVISTLDSSSTTSVPIYLDIPLSNENAVKLVEKYAMKSVFETGRMYRLGAGKTEFPKLDLNRIYGITSFELG